MRTVACDGHDPGGVGPESSPAADVGIAQAAALRAEGGRDVDVLQRGLQHGGEPVGHAVFDQGLRLVLAVARGSAAACCRCRTRCSPAIAVPVTIKAPVPASSVQAPASAAVAEPIRLIASMHGMANCLHECLTPVRRRHARVVEAMHILARHDHRQPRLCRQVSRSRGSEDGCDRHRLAPPVTTATLAVTWLRRDRFRIGDPKLGDRGAQRLAQFRGGQT